MLIFYLCSSFLITVFCCFLSIVMKNGQMCRSLEIRDPRVYAHAQKRNFLPRTETCQQSSVCRERVEDDVVRRA